MNSKDWNSLNDDLHSEDPWKSTCCYNSFLDESDKISNCKSISMWIKINAAVNALVLNYLWCLTYCFKTLNIDFFDFVSLERVRDLKAVPNWNYKSVKAVIISRNAKIHVNKLSYQLSFPFLKFDTSKKFPESIFNFSTKNGNNVIN